MRSTHLFTLGMLLILGARFLQAQTQLAQPRLFAPSNQATAIRVNPILAWYATAQATAYDLQVSTDSTFFTSVISTSGLTDTTYRLTGLLHKAIYYWHLRGVNAGGPGTYSATFSFKTRAPSPGPEVQSADAVPMLRHAANIAILTGDAFETADVSGDGTVSAYDAALVLQFAAGLLTLFPVDQ